MKFKKGDKVKLVWDSREHANNKATGVVVGYDNKFKQYNVKVDPNKRFNGGTFKFNEDEMTLIENKIKYKDFFITETLEYRFDA